MQKFASLAQKQLKDFTRQLVFVHLFDVGSGGLGCPVGGAVGSLAGPQHVAQPFDLLQGGGLRDLKLDVPDLLRRQAGRVDGRSGSSAASGRKWLAGNERLGAFLDIVQLLFALLRLEQGLGFGAFLWKKNLDKSKPISEDL